jgi:hypothetical protein
MYRSRLAFIPSTENASFYGYNITAAALSAEKAFSALAIRA